MYNVPVPWLQQLMRRTVFDQASAATLTASQVLAVHLCPVPRPGWAKLSSAGGLRVSVGVQVWWWKGPGQEMPCCSFCPPQLKSLTLTIRSLFGTSTKQYYDSCL